jgi:hypothetical protein
MENVKSPTMESYSEKKQTTRILYLLISAACLAFLVSGISGALTKDWNLVWSRGRA